MAKQNIWTREQLIVALNLYWKVPYNKISGSSNAKIKEISVFIDRTPAALAYKLMNFTSLDPERQDKGNKGKSGAGSGDKIVWNEYFGQWEQLAFDSAIILSKLQNKSIEEVTDIPQEDIKHTEGKEKERLVKTRVNQSDFRRRILASYNEKCCITGLNIPTLLVASHIIPWSKNEQERLNPRNGLCLNSFHDKAFDKGLITVTNDFKIKLSDSILSKKKDAVIQKYFSIYENQTIILPDRFMPSIEFLEYHQTHIFNR
jgi:putative restriction endonuclease